MATLEELNREFKGDRVSRPQFPSIKIDQDDDSELVGTIFVASSEKVETADGVKWNKIRKNTKKKSLGIHILKRRYQFMYYDAVGNLVIASTSEFDSWDDTVHVMDGMGRVIKSGHYSREVKPFLIQKYPKGTGHMLKLGTILYVEIKGKIYRMKLSGTSVAGIKKEITDPPRPKSLDYVLGSLYKLGVHPLGYDIKMTAVPKKIKIGGKNINFFAFEFELGTERKTVDMEPYNNLIAQLNEYELAKFKCLPQESAPIIKNEDIDNIFESDGDLEDNSDNSDDEAGDSSNSSDDPWDVNDDL